MRNLFRRLLFVFTGILLCLVAFSSETVSENPKDAHEQLEFAIRDLMETYGGTG